MKKITLDLKNCYGIKKLNATLDFTNNSAIAIYAANGAMKSSLARTFEDINLEQDSKDHIFTERTTVRNILDEDSKPLAKESVFVIHPYDEVFGHSEKTSTLLVDSKLRKEYEDLHLEIDKAKSNFLAALKDQSKSKQNIEQEISKTFANSSDDFFKALTRLSAELSNEKDAPFESLEYDQIFDQTIINFLNTSDFKTAIKEYIEQYNKLLASSTYFRKGVFNYFNAATIARSLSDNGFFNANHTVNLNGLEKTEIKSVKQLEELIEAEKKAIVNDDKLKKKFEEIEKQINKNKDLRNFYNYLMQNEQLLPELANIAKFKERVWISYIVCKIDLYNDLMDKHEKAKIRKKEIEAAAAAQRTQWENVIDIFNARFFVPFKLVAKNRIAVILGDEPLLDLEFLFQDGADSATVNKGQLLKVLSTGEKKALYVLNIIFEVETRKKIELPTTFVVDDIADSFDYKNKYAIIEYLRDIAEADYFTLVMLTHNFDFFRTVSSRFVPYNNCFMAAKTNNGLTIQKAAGIKNIFLKDWKLGFSNDARKRISCIPFIRNIIEYTKGEDNEDYLRLTSLLHWKKDSKLISQTDLDTIYNTTFNSSTNNSFTQTCVIDFILETAKDCLVCAEGTNFENKIVLSLAIRLLAEKLMIDRIGDDTFVQSIKRNQTIALFRRFKTQFPADDAVISILQRVLLMTPETIHINSFMYEPILDMGDDHLRLLFEDIANLTK